MSKRVVYLIASLRNPGVPGLANRIEALGHEAFTDWHAAGIEADDYWKKHEQARGRTYREALKGYAAKHVFEFDLRHLERCDTVVLMLPAGKSGHLELGWAVGKGKAGIVLWPPEPSVESDDFRWDVMYQFAQYHCFSEDELLTVLGKV